jgi:hypothetical protein
MSAGEERDQHLIDDLVLPDDRLAELRENTGAARLNALGESGDGFCQRVSA